MTDGTLLISILTLFSLVGGAITLGAKPFISLLKRIENNAEKQGETNDRLASAISKLTSSVDLLNNNQEQVKNMVIELKKEHREDVKEIYSSFEKINDAYEKRFDELSDMVIQLQLNCVKNTSKYSKEG